MIPELRDLSYEERLKECGLTTLETRLVPEVDQDRVMTGLFSQLAIGVSLIRSY